MAARLISYIKEYTKLLATRHFSGTLKRLAQKKIQRQLDGAQKIILVYTIGKVGSTSVYSSLNHFFKGKHPIFHVHCLQKERLAIQQHYYLNSKRRSIPHHLLVSESLIEALQETKAELVFITLFREPIQRELSSLYQDALNFTTDLHVDGNLMNQVIHEKMSQLGKQLPEEEWLQNELMKTTGIDLLQMPFDARFGFAVYKQEHIKLAVIRLEDLDKQYNACMQQLFETEEQFPLLAANDSKDKYYEVDYMQQKQGLKLNDIDLQRIISQPFIKHIYPDYISKITQRWKAENH